jgi:UDP-N-acetylglucosamine--N-acetylmuramyl-(pentapeptide) pyrophosphoryl-undecaprenol N-acetylglucosamine transferase
MAKKQRRVDSGNGLRLVIAGGGTGGHLFPGIAVAKEFADRNEHNRVLFINAGRSLEKRVLSKLGWPSQTIAIEGIKGRGRWQQLVAASKIPKAIWQSRRMLKHFAADAVLGVGGYSAGPVVFAAWCSGIATALHEQNQLPGVTNRILGHMADRIYVSFDESKDCFAGAAVKITGNPVRDDIIALADRSKNSYDAKDHCFHLLVIGGSQGAHAINMAMIEALPLLTQGQNVRITHQTGDQDLDLVKQAYDDMQMPAVVQPFFTNIADQYRRADLIICRAGATTVAEITVIGKAALFIPFPYAADDHQTRNAQALVGAEAAEMITQSALSGEALARMIDKLAKDRQRLAKMQTNARALGRPNAAQEIVDDIYELIRKI